MGGEYQSEIVVAKDFKEVQTMFYAMVEQAEWDYGHAGYTGTFAEKDEIVEVGIEENDGKSWDEATAEGHCMDNNDKWGPAQAYHLWEGHWYIGGWCSA